nr:isoform 2 of protein root uvb sensitive 3 [Quercus suber]
MEHLLPIWTTSSSSRSVKSMHMRVRLGVRVSSLNHLELMDVLHSAGSHYKKAKYLLVEKKGIISAILHKDSTS